MSCLSKIIDVNRFVDSSKVMVVYLSELVLDKGIKCEQENS